MQSRKLKIIPKPDESERVILRTDSKDISIIIKGEGDLDLLCGSCGAILAKGINEGQIRNIVLYCNKCRSYNDTL